MQERIHVPVMKKEVLHYLLSGDREKFLDATLGAGGHSEAILIEKQSSNVIGIDWDAESLDKVGARLKLSYGDRIRPVWGNFALIYKLLSRADFQSIDGVVADFGTSRDQIFSKPGFSFQHESFLDMRFSQSHVKTTAAEVLATFEENELADIFFKLGEEPFAKKIAKKICEARENQRISSTKALANLIISIKGKPVVGKIHPATKVFQALRIFVNRELENINSFLKAVPRFLKPGGRLVCISFHSLEDRLVKDFMQEMQSLGKCRIITKKPQTPTSEEIAENPPSRSAKMRVAEFF